MDAVSESPVRHPLRTAALAAGGVIVVLAGAALIVFLWLRTYAPLSTLGAGTYAPGAGLAADVEPVPGSGGKPVFIPTYSSPRSFDTAFTIHNGGHFAVTILGLGAEPGRSPRPQTLLGADSPTADPDSTRPFRSVRLNPGDTAALVVRWQLDCAGTSAELASDTLAVRYRYLSLFTRTARVRLPFAVTLRCSRGP
jgi:hypothetical protein